MIPGLVGILVTVHARALPRGDPSSPYRKPGSAGAGYSSPKLRAPRWTPEFSIAKSTVAMPCNYSGYYDLDGLRGFGYLQFDWSNNKDRWCQDKPMTASESISEQSALVYKKFPGVKIGVYRNGIKAVNIFSEQRRKLDDPAYSGWFIPYHAYPHGGWQKNHSCRVGTPTGPCSSDQYSTSPCTDGKCSGLWHDQTQVPQWHKRAVPGGLHLRAQAYERPSVDKSGPGALGPAAPVSGQPHYDNGVCKEQCDCGKQPCGNYIYDHRNASFAEWFVSPGGPIINNMTLLQTGVVSFYIDDSFWHKGFKQGGGTGGVTETSGLFANDTGLYYPELVDFAAAYTRNMEKLYDTIVAGGGYVWQLFQDGPGLTSSSNAPKKTKSSAVASCITTLRSDWCTPNGTSAMSAVLYAVHPAEPSRRYNDSEFNEQVTAEFLLTRGNWGFIGTDWNGCSGSSSYYPRMSQWDEDFGVPLEAACHEEPAGSGVFVRKWTNATVTWNCTAAPGAAGRIVRNWQS